MNRTQELLNELKLAHEQAPAPRHWTKILLILIFLGIVAGIVCGWLYFREKANLVELRVAKVMPIPAQNQVSVLDATGYVTARRIATVSSNITGRITEVLIEEGQYVEAGQILARLDPIDAQAQQRLNEAQLAAARSTLVGLQAQLQHAENDARRQQELAAKKFIGQAQLEQSLSQRDALRAQVETARNNVTVADSQTKIAQNSLANTSVKAPFSGVIIAKSAQPGEIVSPLSAGGGFTRTGIGTLVDMNSLEIEINVNESYIGRVEPKMPVEAVLNAYPDVRIPAEVIAVIPTADRNKATVRVRIGFKAKDKRIVPEMGVKVSFLNAKVTSTALEQGVLIPPSAVFKQDGKTLVMVISAEHKIERRQIELGKVIQGNQQVLAGLAANDSIALEPNPSLLTGQQVKIAP